MDKSNVNISTKDSEFEISCGSKRALQWCHIYAKYERNFFIQNGDDSLESIQWYSYRDHIINLALLREVLQNLPELQY